MNKINLNFKVIAIYFSYITTVFSSQYTYFRINHEINDFNDKETAIAFVIRDRRTSTETGISISEITSDKSLERANRHNIYPVYAFASIFLDAPISPFLELGVDLGDLLIDKLDEGHALDTDIYYSAGLKIKFNKQFYLTVYAKTYELYFNEINDITIQNTTLDMKGISMGFYF